MNFKTLIWMAWRYLIARKGGGGLSFMTVVSVLGVGIGVSALIIVLSVMGGFEKDLKDKLLQGEPHIEITNKTAAVGFSLKEYPSQQFEDRLKNFSGAEPYIQADVVLKNGKHLAGSILYGFSKQISLENRTWNILQNYQGQNVEELFKSHVPLLSTENQGELPAIILGQDLASTLNLQEGDVLEIISPSSQTAEAAIAGNARIKKFVFIGSFRTGNFTNDSKWSAVDIDQARQFMLDYDPSMEAEKFVSGYAFKLKDPYSAGDYEKNLANAWPELQAVSWLSANKSILFALLLEKYAMGSVLMLIVVVAAFSISGTMMMTVIHKKSQISILRALGMNKKALRSLFLCHGMTIGLTGSILGLGFGLGICYLIRYFKFVPLPEGVYYLKTMPVKFLPVEYAVICMLAIVCSIVASIYPASAASKQNPSQGMRFDG